MEVTPDPDTSETRDDFDREFSKALQRMLRRYNESATILAETRRRFPDQASDLEELVADQRTAIERLFSDLGICTSVDDLVQQVLAGVQAEAAQQSPDVRARRDAIRQTFAAEFPGGAPIAQLEAVALRRGIFDPGDPTFATPRSRQLECARALAEPFGVEEDDEI